MFCVDEKPQWFKDNQNSVQGHKILCLVTVSQINCLSLLSVSAKNKLLLLTNHDMFCHTCLKTVNCGVSFPRKSAQPGTAEIPVMHAMGAEQSCIC